MAATDPVAWVRATPPFDGLAQPLFDEAARQLDVAFYPAGTRLVRVGGAPLDHLYVIRKGAVRLERRDRTLQVLEEGEIFGYTSLLSREATIDVVVDEDLVAYRIPAAAFHALMADPGFAKHFAGKVAQRVRASLEQPPLPLVQPDLSLEVRHLVARPPVWIDAGATVGDAARRMREEGVSSVLVRADPPAIVTDLDFRRRVLAAGMGPERPVSQIWSRPLHTVPERTPLYEAWRLLLDASVHHLPVTREDEIVGVVTATDLLRHNAHGPLALLWQVERLSSREELEGYGDRVAQMTSALLAGRLDALSIAGFVARLNDALLARILRWAEADLGVPPAPWAWIVFGSEGRMEQTLLTDQDNALIFADEGAAKREWFARLAERVNADLEFAGFPACPGGYMARAWHDTLSSWVERFQGWMNVPTPQAILVAAIFFDFRKVGGELDLRPLDDALATAPRKSLFLRLLAKDALEHRPAQLLRLRFRPETARVDLKRTGIFPIVALARAYALERGVRSRSTVERLRAASAAMGEDWDTVVEAYRFLLALRLRHQLAQHLKGERTTNEISLGELSALERSRFKESLRAIRVWQEGADHHFQVAF